MIIMAKRCGMVDFLKTSMFLSYRFKQKPPLPWTAINASLGVLVITLLVGHIFHAAISRIAKVENDYRDMMELKARAEAADVAKSQVHLLPLLANKFYGKVSLKRNGYNRIIPVFTNIMAFLIVVSSYCFP